MPKTNKCIIECPKCLMPFATLTWQFGKPISAKNFKFKDGKTKLKEGDNLTCTACGYAFRECDVMLAMIRTNVNNDEKN